MKQTITQHELELLDDLAVAAGDLESAFGRIEGQAAAADGVRHAQARIAHAIASLLAVDDWDQEKWKLIGAYIRAGGREQLEAFCSRLGITVEVEGQESRAES